MDEVPGNSRQESAVLVQECGINVDDMDSRHICFVQLPVDHFILDAQGVFRRFPPGKDVQKNVLFVCHHTHKEWLYSDSCLVKGINWIVKDKNEIPEKCTCNLDIVNQMKKLRYLG